MRAVIYDPVTGAILQMMEGSEANIAASAAAMAAAWLPLAADDGRIDLDTTHRVIDGQLEPIE